MIRSRTIVLRLGDEHAGWFPPHKIGVRLEPNTQLILNWAAFGLQSWIFVNWKTQLPFQERPTLSHGQCWPVKLWSKTPYWWKKVYWIKFMKFNGIDKNILQYGLFLDYRPYCRIFGYKSVFLSSSPCPFFIPSFSRWGIWGDDYIVHPYVKIFLWWCTRLMGP